MITVKQPSITPATVWVLVCAVLNAAGWILSATGQLNPAGYAVLLIPAAIATVWWWRAKRPRILTGIRASRFKRPFPLAFAILVGLALLGGILHPPSNYDALAYRTPRVLHWLAEGHWHWIHTDFNRLNTRGAGIEWVSAPLLLFTGTDRFVFLINAVSFLLMPGLCFRVLTGLGVGKRVAWHWMWVIPTGYCFLLQAGSISNDLFGAALVLAAFDFALCASREKNAGAGWLAILAAALMTAGKGFNLLLLLPWGLAMLPATRVMLRRPILTSVVCLFGILISLIPTAVLNHHYCGDWKGLKAEAVNLATGEPALHLGVNSALILLHNFNPTFNPLTGVWNGWMKRIIPPDLAERLAAQFEASGAQFKLPEIQMEESSGLGFGISLLLIPVLIGRIRLSLPSGKTWPAVFCSPSFLVPGSALLVTLYFFTQSGLACPARYLAPSYVLLLAPVLRLHRATELLRIRWWRGLAMFGFLLAGLLLVASPPRPLWPAQTFLKAIRADQSPSPILQRIWSVYSVYGARADGFAPVRGILPPDLKVLGLLTFDDPETSLWRPFGKRRIVHVTSTDDVQALKQRGVQQVLVSEYILNHHLKLTMAEWLTRFDGEIAASFDLPLRASIGPTRWHLVRLRTEDPLNQ